MEILRKKVEDQIVIHSMEVVTVVFESKNAAAGEQVENNGVVHEKHDAVLGGSDIDTPVLTVESEPQSYHRKHNRIHVSCNKKHFLFYVNLAKKFLNHVTVSSIVSKGDQTGQLFHKAKIEILLVKLGQMDDTTGAMSNEDANNNAITE
ncbi:hypothetical protein K1719_002578 [Acacia pycnantha]|nr:hypothetical protein K1719_002578 [Acacia pycnantha]